MEKANLNNPPMEHMSPPSYDQATGSSISQPQQQRSYPNPPLGFIPPNNHPQAQQQPIYPTNYPQQQAQQPFVQADPVVYVQNTVLPLGPREVYVTCPFCHVKKITRIEPEPSSKTHLMAALLCVLGFWCCACMPYCMDSCMNINHYCGNCNNFLGSYSGDR